MLVLKYSSSRQLPTSICRHRMLIMIASKADRALVQVHHVFLSDLIFFIIMDLMFNMVIIGLKLLR